MYEGQAWSSEGTVLKKGSQTPYIVQLFFYVCLFLMLGHFLAHIPPKSRSTKLEVIWIYLSSEI